MLDWWEQSERRRRLRERAARAGRRRSRRRDHEPGAARERGLTSTVTFPRGNLAPEGSVIKSTAIDPSVVDADGVYRKTGPARVFTQREGGRSPRSRARAGAPIRPGDVLVLIGRGPMGAGMEEIYQITSALKHLSFGKHVAVLTDARFSGVSTGACIGHVGPEALAGGPIGKVRDGDLSRSSSTAIVWKAALIWSAKERGELRAEEGTRVLAIGRRAGPGGRPGPAGRHPALGGPAARGRRHLGRLRLRRGGDRRRTK